MTNELLARIDLLTEQLEDYKSRCEKGIEYINKLYNLYYEQGINFEIMYKSQVDKLLNILQNGSEEKMSAKEMFEKLGYDFEITEWQEFKPDYNYIDKDGNVIYFDLEDKELCFMPAYKQMIIRQPLKFIQAINKQVEELGWLGSDDNE